MTDRPNVLLVVLDSVRAKNTSLHGYERETTPFLDDFADRATVYSQARAPGIHSIASHVSMFTGTHVEEHGATRHTTQIDPSRTIWHELAADHGYETGLFTNNRIVSNASNLADPFDYVHEPTYPLAERIENRIDGTALERAYFRWYDGISRLSERVGSGEETGETTAGDGGVGAETGGNSGGQAKPNGETASGSAATGTRGNGDGGDGGREDSGLSAHLGHSFGWLTDRIPLPGAGESGYKTLHGGAFTDAFLEWESEQDGPWAACINLMDAHSPYEPEAEYDRWASEDDWRVQREAKPSVWETLSGRGWDRLAALEPLYDGTILQADAVVGDLVASLEARDLLDDTLLVVTSDHGEAFGEGSRVHPGVRVRDHKWGIHEVLTHVPLVVSYPGQTLGRAVEDVVSLTDLPTMFRTAPADGDEADRFTAGDEVLASTDRLPAEKATKYSSIEDIEDYVGPWRAVYETSEEGVQKFAQHGDQYVTVDIGGAGEATVQSREPHDRVAKAYDPLVAADLVTRGTAEIDEELEQKLEDLGYIR